MRPTPDKYYGKGYMWRPVDLLQHVPDWLKVEASTFNSLNKHCPTCSASALQSPYCVIGGLIWGMTGQVGTIRINWDGNPDTLEDCMGSFDTPAKLDGTHPK